MASPEDCQREEYTPLDEAEARFERAADAVVTGDRETLARLLDEDPSLAWRPSPRPHRVTLLHYVSANGFEPRRQKSPSNAVTIAELLFERGAQPDPTCEFGEGGPNTTPLIGVVTSVWTHRAGVQADLVDVFVANGAKVNGLEDDAAPLELALGFGYTVAAEALARGGARVSHVIHSAGLGDLEAVRAAFDEKGQLRSEHVGPAGWCTREIRTPDESVDLAFVAACRHRRLEVCKLLRDRGADLGAHGNQGFTPLHTAAWYGHGEILEWLLSLAAPLEELNAYGGTVLDGTCWGAINAAEPGVDHAAIIERLCQAGASVQAIDPFPTGDSELDAILRRHGR